MHLQYLITRPCSAHSIYNAALGSQEFVCSKSSHKVCALKRLPRFRTLISEIVLLKIHYNEGLSPLSVLRSSALLKYEQVIKRMCLTLPWARWHRITKQLLGKAFVTKGRLPLPGGVDEEDHFKNQTQSLSSSLWRGMTTANISHLCPAYILQLANMSKSLSGKLERKGLHRHPRQGTGNEEVRAMTSKWRRGNSVRRCECSKSYTDVWKLHWVKHFIRAWLCWSGIYRLIKSQQVQEDELNESHKAFKQSILVADFLSSHS